MTYGENLPIDYQLGNPRIVVYNSKGLVIVDSSAPNLGLSSFSYTFSEEESDSVSLEFGFTSIGQFDLLDFSKYQSLSLSWGYPDFMRPAIKVMITEVTQSYKPGGLTLSVSCSDNFSIFTKTKSPLLLKAENIQTYLKAMSDMGLVVEALKAQASNKFTIFKDGKYYSVSGILAPYADNLSEPYPAKDAPTGPYLRGELGENRQKKFYHNSQTNKKPLSAQLQDVVDMKAAGKSRGQLSAESMIYSDQRARDIAESTKKESSSTFWGIPKDAIGEGKNPQEVLTNTLAKSDEDWNVTGHGDKLIIHNRNLMHSPTREFTWGEEPGFLLEVSCGTESQYAGTDSALSRLAVNPETGALTVKDFLDHKNETRDIETPQQYALLSREIKATAQMLSSDEAQSLMGVYDDQGLIQGGIMRTADVSMASTRSELANGQQLMAVDNTNVMVPGYVVAMPVFDEAAERIDEVIKNLKTGEGGKKMKMTIKIIGDPYIACSENIMIKGISKSYSGKYHITKCTHTIDKGGYTVSMDAYPVFLISNSVATVSSSHTKEEINTKLKTAKEKDEREVTLPLIPSGNVLMDRLPQNKYTLIWVDKKGETHYTDVLGKGTPQQVYKRAQAMGYKGLAPLLPGFDRLIGM